MIMIEATTGLADRLTKLKRRVWQETYTGIYPAQKLLEFDEARHAEKFRRLIADPANQVVLLREDGQDAGYFVLGKPRPGWTGPPISVNALYLISDFQHRGLGRQVWQEIERRVKQAGFTVLGCRCNEHNERALAFYRRQGGVEIARESGHADRSEDQISLLFHLE